MVTLHNVNDTRTGNFYSVAIVKRNNARWFIEVEDETGDSNTNK